MSEQITIPMLRGKNDLELRALVEQWEDRIRDLDRVQRERGHVSKADAEDRVSLSALLGACREELRLRGPANRPASWEGAGADGGGGLVRTQHPEGALMFETRDGQSVAALPLKHRFADLDRKGIEYRDIGPGSMGRMIRARILGDATGLNDAERRAMGEGTGIGGGWFVPSLVSSYVIDLARNAAVTMQAGAWTLPMDGPEVTLVKVLTDPTAYFLAEHAAITESDGSFGPITLKAIILGALVRVSAALLEDAPAAGSAIDRMLAAALGLELDRAVLLGNGSNEPKGLWSCAGINVHSMGANGAAPTNYDPFSYAFQYVLEDNGTPTAVIMAPRTFGTLDRLKEGTTNAPLGAPQSYRDMQKFVTNQIPITQTQGTSSAASCAFVGDFKNVVVGMRRQLTIDVNPAGATDSFAKVETMVRATMRVDVAILRENHFTIIKGLL